MFINYVRLFVVIVLILPCLSEAQQVPLVWQSPPVSAYFVGRAQEIEKINSLLEKEKIVTITGLAGIGKSQLARKYIHTYNRSYDFIWWFDAKRDLSAQFTELSLALSSYLPAEQRVDSRLSSSSILQHVKDILRTTNKKWLLVFEEGASLKELEPFLPTVDEESLGHILITSRNSLGWKAALKLNPLEREDSIALLQKIIGKKDIEGLDELAALFEGHPWALSQAAFYSRFNLSSDPFVYIKLYNEERNKLREREESFINKNKDLAPVHDDNCLTFNTALTINLEKIKEENPLALEMLKAIAFIDRRNISQEYLENFLGDQKIDVQSSISSLEKYNIIRREKGGNNHYNIYMLVQKVIRENIIENPEIYLTRSIKALKKEIINKRKTSREIAEKELLSLCKHTEKLIKSAEKLNFTSSDLIELKIYLAHYCEHLERAPLLSEDFIQKLDEEVEESESQLDPLSLAIYYPFRSAYQQLFETGKNKGEIYSAEEIENSIKLLKDFPEYSNERAMALFYLGQSYITKGEFSKVDNCLLRFKEALPQISPHIKVDYYSLKVWLKMEEEKFKEALAVLEEGVGIARQATRLNQLYLSSLRALILTNLERFKEAEKAAKEVCAEAKQHFDSVPSNFLGQALLALAKCEINNGNFQRAIELTVEALKAHTSFYRGEGVSHDQAHTHVIRGEAYLAKGDYISALKNFIKAKNIYEKFLTNKKLPKISHLYSNLLICAVKCNDEAMAREYFTYLVINFGSEFFRKHKELLELFHSRGLTLPL